MLKIELKRALKRKSFIIGMIFCIFLCVANIIQSLSPLSSYIRSGILCPYEYFQLFSFSNISNLFYMIVPIIATLSYGDSYLEDYNSRSLRNILSRYPKSKYYRVKFLANFIISGMTISLPLLIQILILLCIMPNAHPNIIGIYSMHIGNFNLDLYLNNPLLYTFVWIFISFMFAGAISSIALAVSTFIRNKFIALASPFILLITSYFILDILNLSIYSPLSIIYPGGFAESATPLQMVISFTIIIVSTFCMFYLGGKYNESF